MPLLQIGIIEAQSAAHLHLTNHKSLWGVQIEIHRA
jgi:hypothetical protein